MSVSSFDPNQDVVTFTESAIKHFAAALKGKESHFVRLSTRESGCTGFAYELDVVAQGEADDIVLKPVDTMTFAIAQNAIGLIKGTEIDMVSEGINRVVKFNNPNVTAECGCGESFSVN